MVLIAKEQDADFNRQGFGKSSKRPLYEIVVQENRLLCFSITYRLFIPEIVKEWLYQITFKVK